MLVLDFLSLVEELFINFDSKAYTALQMKFSIKGFLIKCTQIRWKLYFFV